MISYYNENDKYAAEWLRNLISAGLIAPGEVDDRSILDVRPSDLDGFTQCHFFAGIAGWSYALRLAGWQDASPVWTASCPCQPLSSAGLRKGHVDERHLWPTFYELVAERRPAAIFGEQVASKDGREWLAGIRADLEVLGYACGASDLCAAGIGAPHPRQRIYWLADANGGNAYPEGIQRSWKHGQFAQDGECVDRLADSERPEWRSLDQTRDDEGADCLPQRQESPSRAGSDITDASRMGHAASAGLQGQWSEYRPSGERCRGLVGLAVQAGVPEWNGPTVAVECSDGARRVSAQPDAFPLAHGVPSRMGRLRAYGNAIVPPLAAQFIAAYLGVRSAA